MACCKDVFCAGFSYSEKLGGCYKSKDDCFVKSASYVGFSKPKFVPPSDVAANITVIFADLGVTSSKVSHSYTCTYMLYI